MILWGGSEVFAECLLSSALSKLSEYWSCDEMEVQAPAACRGMGRLQAPAACRGMGRHRAATFCRQVGLWATWRRAVIFLVLLIALLQVIHISLLSRLESRKGSHQAMREGHGWASQHTSHAQQQQQHGQRWQPQKELKRGRDLMFSNIQQSSVLDSSGEFRIVSHLMLADTSAAVPQRLTSDVALITQCSISHLYHVPGLVKRWHGPLSVALFAMTNDIPFLIESILYFRQCFPGVRANTTFHLVYPLNNPNDKTVSMLPLALDKCTTLLEKLKQARIGENYNHRVPYPNNLLRNVARSNTPSEFVFLIDVDMLPNDNLFEGFMKFAEDGGLFLESHRDDKTVYVVPAFEMKEGEDPPLDKTSLLQLVELMEVRPFYFELCWKCQKHTDYEAWQREPMAGRLSVLFEVLWRDPWEPFFFSRNSAPNHDERFRQYGFNRISQVCELHVAGYKFSVLNDAFVVHVGLKTSGSFYKEKEADQEKNRLLFRQFKTQLKTKYPDSSRRCY